MEIMRQADYYGLPEPPHSPAPPIERVADLLAPPVPWSGPMKVGAEDFSLRDYHNHMNSPEGQEEIRAYDKAEWQKELRNRRRWEKRWGVEPPGTKFTGANQ